MSLAQRLFGTSLAGKQSCASSSSDDEPSIRRTTRIAVESSGHTAAEAPNAAKAMKAAEEEGFDAVFLDLKLGADDGLEVLGRADEGAAAPRP